MSDVRHIEMIGARLTLADKAALLAQLTGWVRAGEQRFIIFGNAHLYNLAAQQPRLRALVNKADWVHIDGFGVRLGAWLLGYAAPPRATWADFMWELAQTCVEQRMTLYFVGARPGVARRAADRLQERFPDLQIVGVQHGYFDKQPGSAENRAVVAAVNAASPDILIIGFGNPLQEYWFDENRASLDCRVVMTCGAAFDYVSGELRRAPRLFTEHGLEWLGRLLIEPRRLARRYLVGNPVFLWNILRQRLGLLHLPETPTATTPPVNRDQTIPEDATP